MRVSGKSAKKYEPCPEGVHQAVCIDVHDRGEMETQHGKVHKLDIWWAIDPESAAPEDTENEGQYFKVWQRYTASIHEKSYLHRDLVAWRGRKFTDAELEDFELDKLIGANCQLQIIHNVAGNGNTYANVQAVMKIGKKMTKIGVPDDYVRFKDRTEGSEGGTDAPADETEPDEDIPF